MAPQNRLKAGLRTIGQIEQRLGYRFELQQGTFPDQVDWGETLGIEITLTNTGWAAPFNPRLVKLLLRNQATGHIYRANLPDDPRFWVPGTHSLSHTICTPRFIPVGDYDLLLHLPDPKSSLDGRPEYSIHLANVGVWEPATGYNDLLHAVTVTGNTSSSTCNGDVDVEPPGDFNNSGEIDAVDIDLLFDEVAAMTHDSVFDLDADSEVTIADADVLVHVVLGTEYGDLNLDSKVSLLDLDILGQHFGSPGGWAEGDLDGSGDVSLLDLAILGQHFGFEATPASGP